MTLDEVNARVSKISAAAGDEEGAHGMEDALHQDVLRAIAKLGGPAGELAAAALETRNIDFDRWYA